ncbi:putative INO80 complex subunit B-like region, Zinc finger, HIT-type, INO80 complex, subunit Ies2 [Dioscorea sansibarensis]
MEAFGGSEFSGASVGKKRRSIPSRGRRSDFQILLEGTKCSPHLSAPSSENASKISLESSLGDDPSLNKSSQRMVSINKINGTGLSKRCKKSEGRSGDVGGFYRNDSTRAGHSGNNEPRRNGSDSRRCSEGVLAPANWKSTSNIRKKHVLQATVSEASITKNGDGYSLDHSVGGSSGSGENKPRKLKFKVGGLLGTMHAKSNTDNASTKSSHPLNVSWHRQKHMLQDNSDDSQFHIEQTNCVQGRECKDFGERHPHGAEEDTRGKAVGKSSSTTQIDKVHYTNSSEPTRKSKRVPKKRPVEDTFDDSDEDDEIRYLERLKSSKIVKDDADDYGHEGNKLKKRKVSESSKSKVSNYDFDEEYVSQSVKDGGRRRKTAKKSSDIAYMEEDEPRSDASLDPKEMKREGSADTVGDGRVGALTTRQRALQSSKDGGTGESLIEFPNGLPSAPRRKQKKKLSEVELQAKKAEAAQRRRMQVEKANRELEAAVINKILGKDPNKKKKEEEKLKEMQEEASSVLPLAPSTVRCSMGATGTTVTFADDIGLPNIFESKPCSYPLPREKCAGPSCTNAYKYRDSKTNLPLCSLQCYRAVQKIPQTGTSC